MQNINVNIVPDNFPQTIRYSQGDIGRQFKINVTDFDIPVGATVKIQATKPSGFGFSVAGVVAGSSVTFTTTAEMTDEAGRFQAELQITAGDDVIGTANFLMIGERNPHPEGTTDGSQGTIIPELTLLVERVEKAASDVLDMEVVATTLPAGSQATYSYDEALNKATFGIPEGQAGAGAAGVVASAYSAAKTYKVGDYVLYNSNLYRCTTAITTAEAWTAAHWTQVVLADDVTDLKTDLNIIATIQKPMDLKSYPYDDGYLTANGVFVPDTPATQKTTKPIYLSAGNYTINFVGVYNGNPNLYARAIAVYNSSDECTHYYGGGNVNDFVVLDSDSYIRINTNAQTITKYLLYLTSTDGEVVAYINDGLVKTDKTLKSANIPADSKAVGDKFNDIVISQDGTLLDESYDDWLNGYINVTNGDFVPTTNTQHTTDFIELSQGKYYGFVCDFVINNTQTYIPRAIVIYNADKTLSRSISPKALTELKLIGTEKYVRININFDVLNSMRLYNTSFGENGTKEYLDENIIIPKKVDNYIHARRPLIAFILDGDYNQNATMEAVFDSHNVKIGFAIPYTETFTTNSITTYFNWEKKGHEILSHSRYAVGLNGSATDEEIAEIVEESYKTLKGYGFDIHGFVAYQGSTKPVTVTNVKKFFDYGCDATNHSASQESCMFFGNDSPYMLWRYSMQLSTLQEMKDAVDRCLANNGLLIFYGHANSGSLGNFTAENLEALLTYIETVGGVVRKPYEAIADYYSIRYDDIIA